MCKIRCKLLRAAISQFIVFAEPAKALPMKKIATEMSIIGRRPKTSERRPQKGIMAVLASPYAEPTHTKSSPPLRTFVIFGTAVKTAGSSNARKKFEIMTARNESQEGRML